MDVSQGVPQLGGQTTVRWQKQVFIHTRLSRAYLALARLLVLRDAKYSAHPSILRCCVLLTR